jgi:hypothetical protein
MSKTPSEKLLTRFKGLSEHLREGEMPLYSTPVIWENASANETQACDLLLTNQRLFGYISTTFPRPRLFLDDLELAQIRAVSLRKKSFEAMFRELLVSDGEKKVYIRATRKKIAEISATIRATIAECVPADQLTTDLTAEQEQAHVAPVYGSQEVRQPLERSPLGITLLLVGGLALEIIGALAWLWSGSLQTGLPLFLAGIIAVLVATLARRQMR